MNAVEIDRELAANVAHALHEKGCFRLAQRVRAALDAPKKGTAVNVVFDGPPAPEAGRFVEVEDDNGNSINVGEWLQRQDGYWALRIALDAPRVPDGVSTAREVAGLCGVAPRPMTELDRHARLAVDARALLSNGGCPHGPNASQRDRLDAILREIAGLPVIARALAERTDPDTTGISPVGRTVGSERTSGYSELYYCPIRPRLEQVPTTGTIGPVIPPPCLREAFEAKMRDLGLDLTRQGAGYRSPGVHVRWRGFLDGFAAGRSG